MDTPLEATGRHDRPNNESTHSGIHWAAILGGAAAAAAITLILIPLGSALGFASFSVFTADASDAVEIGAGVGIWMIVTQWLASGVGGYLAGRMRVKWADLHSDEVFFRDTAHGFLSWAIASLLVAFLYISAAGTVLQTASTVAAGAAENDRLAYNAESLFRGATAPSSDASAEAGRIIAQGMTDGTVTPADRAYLVRQVVARTGLAQPEAEARVNATITRAETAKKEAAEAAEKARKAMVALHFGLSLSLLIGAFIASVAAALGGRLRDKH